MEAAEYEQTVRVVESCAARIRWRLRPHSKRRLLNDILFLCTGLRPVILVDYGGTMPKLQENLCALLHHAQQEASILKPLKVMIIKDMLYLIHVKGLAEHASPNLRSQHQLAFVDLESSCCKLFSDIEDNEAALELVSIQDLFSSAFPVGANSDLLPVPRGTVQQKLGLLERTADADCTDNCIAGKNLEVVDLSAFLQHAGIALPSLNGWLLGYPVTYLFSNESAERAVRNLSMQSLHIYKIFVCRSRQSDAKRSEEELMSFSVPCNMSTKRDEEPWARSFLAYMRGKLERCKHIWASMRLETEVIQSQSHVIVL